MSKCVLRMISWRNPYIAYLCITRRPYREWCTCIDYHVAGPAAALLTCTGAYYYYTAISHNTYTQRTIRYIVLCAV